MSVNRYASTYRGPSSASVQPRAPMSGGTGSYGTLPRRAQPGLNSATPFGYPAQRPGGLGAHTKYQAQAVGGLRAGINPNGAARPQYQAQSVGGLRAGINPYGAVSRPQYQAQAIGGLRSGINPWGFSRPNSPFQMGVGSRNFNIMFPNFFQPQQFVNPLQRLNIPGAV